MTENQLEKANIVQAEIQGTRMKLDWLRQFQKQTESVAKIHQRDPKFPVSSGIRKITIEYVTEHSFVDNIVITDFADMYATLSAVIKDQEQHLKELYKRFDEL